MVGILAEPGGPDAPGREPAVVMLNAGLLHRIGPYRLHVDLARQLARLGFPALRFDRTGVGDSEPRRDRLTAEQRAGLDVRQCLDFLAADRGLRRFVLLGLCSGAVDAHKSAVEDERVAGIVCMDGYAYPTPAFHARRCLRMATHPAKIVSFCRQVRAAWRARRRGASSAADPRNEVFEWDLPPRKRVAAEFRRLAGRGVNMLCVFTAGNRKFYNYRGQLRGGFRDVDFRGRLEEVLFDEADHVFSRMKDRDAVVARICQWMEEKFPR
jgi:alpha-beta hydrolase superfamily lysophospholipase